MYEEELTVTSLAGIKGVVLEWTVGNTQQYQFRNNGKTFLVVEVAAAMTCNLTIFNRVTEAYETITVAAETRIVGPFARATYNDRRDRVLMGIQIPAENTAPNFGVFSL
jgi:hypothetical protein